MSQRLSILIVCEGTETEPNYFNSLVRQHRLSTVNVDIHALGVGKNTLSLVNDALSRQGSGPKRYSEIWCVFDLDRNPDENFDNAIARAENHPFLRVAWSNEAFELWFVLHFQYLDTAPSKKAGGSCVYYNVRLDKLMQQLGCGKYDKADPTLCELLGSSRLEVAIKNAKRLQANYAVGTPYHQRKPATTVHELVERLLSFAPENQRPT